MMLVLMLSSIEEREWWRGWSPLGPISSHCRSRLVACFPRVRLNFGRRR